MRYFDEFDEYIERLLLLQFEASEIINHNLTRGEIREDFLKEQVKKQFEHFHYHKGVICHNKYESDQIDVIVTQNTTRCRRLGEHSIVDIKDVEMIIEVKTCAKTSDFRKLNALAKELKELDSQYVPKVGMFCYSYEIKERNLLKKFSYRFDEDIQGYELDEKLYKEYEYIDFVLAMDKDKEKLGENKDFFIIKDITGDFMLFKDKPVSKYFFNLFSHI
ncbi:hypothetical protein CLPU_1c01080 [Gottschalkia purinilytica]|uniref:DUF6602 domain-containing protein n=1 Tax=Gottschalkia purinilytica TaxID=1503 RepID=A0A0L0WEP0_GOTPU|nr:DUF6602 domain-containing protein [Gottschalkia purinilytica]KNF09943.1 hypothetical protein CLPU_1c01080 [Gottschalkia purinilytica]